MRAAALQLEPVIGGVRANLAACERLADSAAAAGAELIVLPEFFATGIGFVPAIADSTLPPDGAATELLKSLAVRHGATVGGSFLCRDADREVRNAFFLATPDGVVGRHDKDIPTMWESCFYVGGNDQGIIEVDGLSVGVALCWEFMRTQTARRLRGGVDLVVGGSFVWGPPDQGLPPSVHDSLEEEADRQAREWGPLLARRVGAPVVEATHCGRLDSRTPWMPAPYRTRLRGGAQICDATGTVLARREASEGPGFVIADITPQRTTPQEGVPPGYWAMDVSPLIRFTQRYQTAHGRRWYRRHTAGRPALHIALADESAKRGAAGGPAVAKPRSLGGASPEAALAGASPTQSGTGAKPSPDAGAKPSPDAGSKPSPRAGAKPTTAAVKPPPHPDAKPTTAVADPPPPKPPPHPGAKRGRAAAKLLPDVGAPAAPVRPSPRAATAAAKVSPDAGANLGRATARAPAAAVLPDIVAQAPAPAARAPSRLRGRLSARGAAIVLAAILVLLGVGVGVLLLTQGGGGAKPRRNVSNNIGLAATAAAKRAAHTAPKPKKHATQKRATQPPVDRSQTTVAVLNGTTTPGLAVQISDQLQRAGFKGGSANNAADTGQAQTLVNYAPGSRSAAETIARILKVKTVQPIDPGTRALAGSNALVVVTLGADRTR